MSYELKFTQWSKLSESDLSNFSHKYSWKDFVEKEITAVTFNRSKINLAKSAFEQTLEAFQTVMLNLEIAWNFRVQAYI